MSFEVFLSRLRGVKKTPQGWKARCPAHADKTPSLSISRGANGILCHCHVGCSIQEITASLNMSVRELFLESDTDSTNTKKIVDEYIYLYENGEKALKVIRYFPKTFRQQRWDGSEWNWKGEKPKLLFNLKALIDHPKRAVILVEGEKAVNRLTQQGFLASCNVGGCLKWLPKYNKFLKGRAVILLADNDKPGQKDVTLKAESLIDQCEIRIPELQGLTEGQDIVDWLKIPGNNKDKLKELIRETPLLTRESLALRQESPAVNNDYPTPEPLPEQLVPVEDFDPELLPTTLREWAIDSAHRMGIGLDFVAIAAITSLSSLIGTQLCIQCKKNDSGWRVVPNLWGCIVSPAGSLKSPAVEQFLMFLRELENESRDRYEEQMEEYELRRLEWEDTKKNTELEIKKHLKDGEIQAARNARRELQEAMVDEPSRRRYLINDATVEAVASILSEDVNKNGILVFRDEIMGFIKSLDVHNQSEPRSFYLEAWQGSGSFSSARISRKCQDIKHACVSVLGTCQPEPLRAYLSGEDLSGLKSDGLVQRFQLVCFPDSKLNDSSPSYVDKAPSLVAKEMARSVYKRLNNLDVTEFDAAVDEDGGMPFTTFDDEAQLLFQKFYEELSVEIQEGKHHPTYTSHIAKFRSLVPSLALIIHVCQGKGRVTGNAMARALAFAIYLKSHAKRIYQSARGADIVAVYELARHVKRGDLGKQFTAANVLRKNWRSLNKSSVPEAINELVDLKWLEEIRKDWKNGRAMKPYSLYKINPRIEDL